MGRAVLFKCQRISRKQFSSLWRPCEVGVSPLMCGNPDKAVLTSEDVL